MPRIEFTSQLAQHVECPPQQQVKATTLHEALEVLFGQYPRLRDYVMDDQGALRPHIALFVDGEMLQERDIREIPLASNTEIFVMQALSGG